VRAVKARGASLKATEQPIDTSTAAGKCFLDMRGVYKGRKASIDPAKVKQMKNDGMGPSAIAKALKIGRASVYRALTS
jgi:DNA invertase Pin-like site-specific DNA recombinase